MAIVRDGWPASLPPATPVAAFELDGTLIVPVGKGRKVRPKGADDWAFRRYPEDTVGEPPTVVIRELTRLAREGYAVAVLSNQSSRGRGGREKNDAIVDALFGRIADAVGRAGGPGLYLAGAVRDERHRKPMRGMWDLVVARRGRGADNPRDFYCGDAAGRPGDFARSDYAFAHNVGIGFRTPEMVFGGDATPPPPLSRPAYRTRGTPRLNVQVKYVCGAIVAARAGFRRAVLVVFVGFPGSGKSTLARQVAAAIRGVHLAQDECSNSKAFESRVGELLAEGSTVIADRTNLTPEHRVALLSRIAPNEPGRPRPAAIAVDLLELVEDGVRGVRLGDGVAWHRNCARADRGGPFVPKMAYARLKKNAAPVDDGMFAQVLHFPPTMPPGDCRVYDSIAGEQDLTRAAKGAGAD
jgi:DNA 3'-phosphatase